jgi:hypothetical protein
MSQMLVRIPAWNLLPKSGPAIHSTFVSAQASQWPHQQLKSHKRENPVRCSCAREAHCLDWISGTINFARRGLSVEDTLIHFLGCEGSKYRLALYWLEDVYSCHGVGTTKASTRQGSSWCS